MVPAQVTRNVLHKYNMKFIAYSLTLALVGCATTPSSNQERKENEVIILTQDECFIGRSINVNEVSKNINPNGHITLYTGKSLSNNRVGLILDELKEVENKKNIKFKLLE